MSEPGKSRTLPCDPFSTLCFLFRPKARKKMCTPFLILTSSTNSNFPASILNYTIKTYSQYYFLFNSPKLNTLHPGNSRPQTARNLHGKYEFSGQSRAPFSGKSFIFQFRWSDPLDWLKRSLRYKGTDIQCVQSTWYCARYWRCIAIHYFQGVLMKCTELS